MESLCKSGDLAKLVEDGEATFNYCVRRCLQKLNLFREESLANIEKLQHLVLGVRRTKIFPEDVKLILLGDGSIQGILSHAISSPNELVCQHALQVIINFTNP